MMKLESLVRQIKDSSHDLLELIQTRQAMQSLGLRRSARLAFLAALHAEINRPILLLTDRPDHALTLLDELGMWSPGDARLFFPEPNPLFYEQAAWGENTRRDRLIVLTALASYHIPGADRSQPNHPCDHRLSPCDHGAHATTPGISKSYTLDQSRPGD
jgi:hypothetical protein